MTMRMKAGKVQRKSVTGFVLLAGTMLAHAALAQAAPAAAQPVTDEGTSQSEAKGSDLGVHVHGHWLLQVKNADGTLGGRREFDNSLVTTGANTINGVTLLDGLILGNLTPAGFGIALITGPASTTGIDASTFCMAPPGSPTIYGGERFAPSGIGCYGFVGSASSLVAQEIFPSQLSLPAPEFGLTTALNATTGAIILSGNYTVPAGMTSITGVQSYLGTCSTTYQNTAPSTQSSLVPPSSCSSAGIAAGTFQNTGLYGGPLTSTTVAPLPLSVTAGQILAVTFTLSFS